MTVSSCGLEPGGIGQGTETLVMEEDAQPLEQPIIAPIKVKKFEVEERDALQMHAGLDFMAGLMSTPHLCSVVAVVGHLHHGKTMIMDMLTKQTHEVSQHSHTCRSLTFQETCCICWCELMGKGSG
jgi:hypothetical protein